MAIRRPAAAKRRPPRQTRGCSSGSGTRRGLIGGCREKCVVRRRKRPSRHPRNHSLLHSLCVSLSRCCPRRQNFASAADDAAPAGSEFVAAAHNMRVVMRSGGTAWGSSSVRPSACPVARSMQSLISSRVASLQLGGISRGTDAPRCQTAARRNLAGKLVAMSRVTSRRLELRGTLP